MALVQRYAFLAAFFIFSFFWAIVIRLGIIFRCSQIWALERLRDWAIVTVWLLENVASIKVVIEGSKNIPEQPCIFVSRHESFFDTLIFFLISVKTCYVMKIELKKVPLYGFISEFVGLIFLDRKGGTGILRKMLGDIEARLGEGRDIVFFPQGTRMRPGEVGNYSAITYHFYRDDVPIVPVALSSGTSWPKNWMIKPTTTIRVRMHPVLARGLDAPDFRGVIEATIEAGSKDLREQG